MSQLAEPDNEAVWFHSEFKFRRSETLRRMASMLLVGCILTGLSVWLLTDWLKNRDVIALVLSCSVLLPGLLALSGGVWQMIGVVSNRVDRLVLSNLGVEYAGRFWNWENVHALRFSLANGARCVPHITVWSKSEKHWPRGGIPMPIDQTITSEQQSKLVTNLKRYFNDRGLRITCDELRA